MLVLEPHSWTIRLLRLLMAVDDDLHCWPAIDIHVGGCRDEIGRR